MGFLDNLLSGIIDSNKTGGFSQGSAKAQKSGGGSNAPSASKGSAKATSYAKTGKSTSTTMGATKSTTPQKTTSKKSGGTGGGSTADTGSTKPSAAQQALEDYATQSAVDRAKSIVEAPAENYGFSALNADTNAAIDRLKNAKTNFDNANNTFGINTKEYDDAYAALQTALAEAETFIKAAKSGAEIKDRRENFGVGNLKQYAGSMLDAAGTAYEGGARGAQAQTEREIADLEQRMERAKAAYEENASETNKAYLEDTKRELSVLKGIDYSKLDEVTDKVYGKADELTTEGAEQIAKAKEGLGKGGQFAVDAASAGAQLLGDIGLGLATGGMASIPMALRSFGGAAGEARRNGATYEEQVGYGAASAALEFATEKLFGGDAGVYGKGLLDNVSQKVLGKLQSSPAGKAALNVLGQMGQEGAEEALASVVTPLLQGIYNGKTLGENWDEVEATDVLYDALIGAVLGGAGAVVSTNTKPTTGEEAMLRGTADGTPTVEAKQPAVPTTPVQASESANNVPSVEGGEITPDATQSVENASPVELNNVTEQVEQVTAAPAPVQNANTPTVAPATPMQQPNAITETPTPAAQVTQSGMPDVPVNGSPLGAGSVTTKAAETVANSPILNEERRAELSRMVEGGQLNFTPDSNAKQIARATRLIEQKGWEQSVSDFISAVEKGIANADLSAMGAVLLNNVANSNASAEQYATLVYYYDQLRHNLGSALQAGRLINQLTPEGRLYLIQRTVGEINQDLSSSQRKKNEQAKEAVTAEAVTQAVEEGKKNAIESTIEAVQEEIVQKVTGKKATPKQKKPKAQGEKKPRQKPIDYTKGQKWEPFDFPQAAAEEIAGSIKKRIKNTMKPAKNKTTLDTFVGYVKRFANEKINLPKGKSQSLTPTELLSEIVQNEELFYEVYEKAQAEFMGIDSTGFREFVEDYLNTPAGLDSSSPMNRIFTRAIAESAMATNENAKYIQKQSALGVSDAEIANVIAKDLIAKTKAEGDLAESMRIAARSYVSDALAKDSMSSEARTERLVSEMMQNIGRKFREVASQPTSTKESIRQDIADMLAMEYALSPESAKAIAESVSNEYDRQLEVAIEKELEARYAPKTRTKKPPKGLTQTLTEAINLGAFNSEYAQKAVEKTFGVDGDIAIPDALLQAYLKAPDEASRDAVLEQIKQSIADQVPATFRDKFTALRYLNMLGNFKTQGRNLLGNAVMTTSAAMKRRVEGGIQSIVSAVSDANVEQTSVLWAGKKLMGEAYSDFDNVAKEAMGEDKYADVGRQIAKDINDKRQIFSSKFLEDYRTLTNKTMSVGDRIFLRATYADAMAGWLKAHGYNSMSEADTDTLNRAREFAIKEAQEATFRDKNAVSDFATNFDRNWGKARIVSQGIVPFRKTAANVAKRAVEYSPLGVAEAIYKGIQTKDGNANANDVINSVAKSTLGTALLAAGVMLSKAGLAKGSEDDEELAAFQGMKGEQNYSIKLGDTYISLSQLAPMAIPFFIGVRLNEALSGEQISTETLGDILTAISEPMLEMSMLSGVNDALSTLSGYGSSGGNEIWNLLGNAVLSYLTQGISNTLLGQLESIGDENRQTTYATQDSLLGSNAQYKLGQFLNKVPLPGADYHQQDYVDAWGRTQSNGSFGERFLNNLFNPTYYSKDRSTEVDAELERLYRDNKDIEGFPSVLPEKRGRSDVYGDGKVMTPDEYLQFSKDSGQMKLELVSDFIGSEQYANLDDKQRAEIINNLYEFADDRALKKVKEANSVNAKSDWDDEAKLPDLPAYLTAKTVYSDAIDTKNEAPNYAAVDAVLEGLESMDKATRDKLDEQNGFKALRFAYDMFGMDSETAITNRNMISETQKTSLGGKDGGSADMAAIAKNVKGSDADKLAALEVANTPDAKTGKREAIVRRTEAAMAQGIPFDDWAKIETYITDAGSTSKATIMAAGEKYGYKGYEVYNIYKKVYADDEAVTQVNDYFSKDYIAPDKVSLSEYLTGEEVDETDKASSGGGRGGYGGRYRGGSSKPANLGNSVGAVKSIANSGTTTSNSSKYMRQALNDVISQSKKQQATQPTVKWEDLLAGYVKGIK